jgi:hypothetical protein
MDVNYGSLGIIQVANFPRVLILHSHNPANMMEQYQYGHQEHSEFKRPLKATSSCILSEKVKTCMNQRKRLGTHLSHDPLSSYKTLFVEISQILPETLLLDPRNPKNPLPLKLTEASSPDLMQRTVVLPSHSLAGIGKNRINSFGEVVS